MASPQQQQQQLMASPQQQAQQQQATPGPSPGGSQQTQPANPSQMNGAMNAAAMTMNPSAMNTINMSAMNSMMNNGMAGMTMTSMAGFQQSMGHQVMTSGAMPQVQVIQQQLPYFPQLYSNAQGQQFIMPGNIALQPTGVNQTIQPAGFGQPIQVITAGKPFQPGQLTPHLQITGKNMLQAPQNDNGTVLQLFNSQRNSGCIPTSNNQTLVIGPLINTQAGNFQQAQQGKPNDVNKQTQQQQQQQQQQSFFQVVGSMPPKSPVMTSSVGNVKGNVTATGVAVSQGTNMMQQQQIGTSQANSGPMQLGGSMQPMQFISQMQGSQMGQPFGLLPSFTWATSGGIAGQQGPILIRGPQPDAMLFQAAPQQTIAAQPGPQTVAGVATAIKPRAETPKVGGTRPLSTILPSSSGASTTPTPIRPASSVSTQTLTVAASPVNVQSGTPRPAGKAKKVGRPPQNQPRAVAPTVVPAQQALLQPVQQQQQLQLQQQQQQVQNQQLQAVPQQLIAQQFQMQHPFQIQQFPQQPALMSIPGFQQMAQHTLDASQQAQLQQAINDQQQAQQQQMQQLQLQYQINKPVMAVASSAATSCATSTNVSTTTQSAPQQQQQQQQMMSSAQTMQQPMQNATPTLQQVVVPQQNQQQQQGLMQLPNTSTSFAPVTTTTTTHTVRSCYKPIAPAPPQQTNQPPNLIAMTPHPQVSVASGEKTDQQHPQILTIPVGSAVYPIGMTGTANIRPANNFQTINGDQGQQLNMQSSGPTTTCFITNPAITTASRMSAPLGGGLITVGPAAPLSAMANMTQAVPPSSTPIAIATTGPRMAVPPLQPVTVAVSSSPATQFPQSSPARSSAPLLSTADKVEESKQSPRAETAVTNSSTTVQEETSTPKKDTSHMNGTSGEFHHSPALREKKEPNLPQAVVRPQILTHVLGDFVIQESSEPFPVGRFPSSESLPRCNGHRNDENSPKIDGEPPKKKLHLEPPTKQQSPPVIPPTSTASDLQQMSTPKGATMATCEGCGKMDFISKFRRSKRFCSTACSKKPAINNTIAIEPVQPTPQPTTPISVNGQGAKPVGDGLLIPATANPVSSVTPDVNKLATPTPISQGTVPPNFVPSGEKEDTSLDAELLALAAQQMRSPTASLSQTPTQQLKPEIKANPAKWSVKEVADFVRNLPGCTDYAEEFAMQEIDGQALMLLKADHLMSAMSMRLGPALKICAQIDAMRSASATEGGNQPNGN